MKHLGYIFLLLMGLSFGWLTPTAAQVPSTDYTSEATTDCQLQAPQSFQSVGLLGEPITCTHSSSVESSVPTHFNGGARRISFGKNRTRTSFLRMMLHRYQPYHTIFHGQPRGETAPYADHDSATYYVYTLMRLLC